MDVLNGFIRCIEHYTMYLWCYSECISSPGRQNLPDYGANRTRDLWFADPMLYQLSYEVKTSVSLGPVYEFVCISFRTDNLNCFRVK